MNKTEIFPIGSQKNNEIKLPTHLGKIRVKHGPSLGVWFSLDKHELINLNLTERLKAIVTLINIWKGRRKENIIEWQNYYIEDTDFT